VGSGGSGAVFFSGCSLSCVFCQTFQISQMRRGVVVPAGDLAEIILDLQARGCHNVNLITPGHQAAVVAEALEIASGRGLRLPVVYNSGGYDAIETLQALAGLVDIYMPDFKVWDEAVAGRLLGAGDYPQVTRTALKEMHRQVGDLVLDGRGLARRGLLVRHLVLPGQLSGTPRILRFLHEEVSSATYLNLMGHYHPCWRAAEFDGLERPLFREEFDSAVQAALSIGLRRLDRTHWPLLRTIFNKGA